MYFVGISKIVSLKTVNICKELSLKFARRKKRQSFKNLIIMHELTLNLIMYVWKFELSKKYVEKKETQIDIKISNSNSRPKAYNITRNSEPDSAK